MKIITPVINNIEFIELQFNSFKKYIKFPYEFIVFNDSKDFPDWTNYGDPTIRKKIEEKCKELGISCINIPNGHHKQIREPGLRHIESVNFMVKYMLDNPDKYLQIDSDMFLVSEFDYTKYSNYDCAVVLKFRPELEYAWTNLFYIDIDKFKYKNLLTNWDGFSYRTSTGQHHTDTGGKSHLWVDKYKAEYPTKIYSMERLLSCEYNYNDIPENLKESTIVNFMKSDSRNKNNTIFSEIFGNCIFHYRAGSNWMGEGRETHDKLTLILKKYLN